MRLCIKKYQHPLQAHLCSQCEHKTEMKSNNGSFFFCVRSKRTEDYVPYWLSQFFSCRDSGSVLKMQTWNWYPPFHLTFRKKVNTQRVELVLYGQVCGRERGQTWLTPHNFHWYPESITALYHHVQSRRWWCLYFLKHWLSAEARREANSRSDRKRREGVNV